MKIPKAEYHIGDKVNVTITEAGCPPSFVAYVTGIEVNKLGQVEYTVTEENGARLDGYTETWLSKCL